MKAFLLTDDGEILDSVQLTKVIRDDVIQEGFDHFADTFGVLDEDFKHQQAVS